jgi:hypothetical protein
MDMERIKQAATDSQARATYAFKVDEDDKVEFIRACEQLGLRPGAVCRELVKQFLEAVE